MMRKLLLIVGIITILLFVGIFSYCTLITVDAIKVCDTNESILKSYHNYVFTCENGTEFMLPYLHPSVK